MRFINGLIFLLVLFSLLTNLILSRLFPEQAPLDFQRERIEFTIGNHPVLVAGNYYFRNRTAKMINTILVFPFSLAYPDTIAINKNRYGSSDRVSTPA